MPPKPRVTVRDRERQGDAGGPHASSGTHEAPSPRRAVAAGATLAHRRTRAPRRRASQRCLKVALPSKRPNDAKNWCTRAAKRQPTNAESPNRGLGFRVGHSGLEPEANGLRRVRGVRKDTDNLRHFEGFL